MDPYLRDKTLNSLSKAESIAINVSPDSGFDGSASGLALLLSLEKLGKTVSLKAKSPTVNEANNLYGVNKIGKTGGKTNLVVAIENAVKNVDKITYFLDGDRLKIVVHALPGGKVEKENISFEQTESEPNVLFSIGYSSGESLNIDFAREQNNDPKVWVVNISNKNPRKEFAHLNLVDPSAASLSEMIAILFQELALPVDEDIAFNLYAGIRFATDNFSPARSKPTSFKSAEWLLKFGAGKASFANDSIAKIADSESPRPKPADFRSFQTANFADEKVETSPEQVEREKSSEDDWLKPPKIYKGSKSFDTEH